MNNVRNLVDNLTDLQKIHIIIDYSELENSGGSIGDSELRTQVEKIIKLEGSNFGTFSLWAEVLIKEVYKYYTLQYIELLSEELDKK